MDGWENLASAIIEVAAHDYKQALKILERYPGSYYAMRQKYKLEQFFRGDLYSMLTDVSGDYLIERLKKEVNASYKQHRLRIKK